MSQQQQTNKQQKTSNMHILWSDGNNSILSCHTIVSFDFYTRKLINKIVYYRKLARATRRKPIRICISNIPVGEWRRLLHTQNMPLSSLIPFVECDCLCARASAPFFMCCRSVVDSTKSSFYKQSFRVRVNTLKHIEYRKSILTSFWWQYYWEHFRFQVFCSWPSIYINLSRCSTSTWLADA